MFLHHGQYVFSLLESFKKLISQNSSLMMMRKRQKVPHQQLTHLVNTLSSLMVRFPLSTFCKWLMNSCRSSGWFQLWWTVITSAQSFLDIPEIDLYTQFHFPQRQYLASFSKLKTRVNNRAWWFDHFHPLRHLWWFVAVHITTIDFNQFPSFVTSRLDSTRLTQFLSRLHTYDTIRYDTIRFDIAPSTQHVQAIAAPIPIPIPISFHLICFLFRFTSSTSLGI